MALERDKDILTEKEIEEALKEIIDEFCVLYKNKKIEKDEVVDRILRENIGAFQELDK